MDLLYSYFHLFEAKENPQRLCFCIIIIERIREKKQLTLDFFFFHNPHINITTHTTAFLWLRIIVVFTSASEQQRIRGNAGILNDSIAILTHKKAIHSKRNLQLHRYKCFTLFDMKLMA